MESEIITYLEHLESISGDVSDVEEAQKTLRAALESKVESILGYTLTDEDRKGLQLMIDDELKDGTIDFGCLEKYNGLYREQTDDTEVPADDCSPAGKKNKVGSVAYTEEVIKAQLAEISIMEHKLAEMKRELFRLYDDLGRSF